MRSSPESGPEGSEYKEKFYSRYASTHNAHRKGEETLAAFRKKMPGWEQSFGRILGPDRGGRIIDLGCGTGSLVWWLQDRGHAHVEGIDISEEQVRIAESLGVRNVKQANLSEFLEARLDTYDLIILRDVLEHFQKDELLDVLGLCRKALKAGGRILVQVPNAESPFFGKIRYGDFTHDLAFTSSSLAQLFHVFGFSDPHFYPAQPVVAGVQSFLRFGIWKLAECAIKLAMYAEQGSGRRIVTQNIIATAAKSADL